MRRALAWALVALATAASAPPGAAQPVLDTLAVAPPVAVDSVGRTSRGAVLRALAVPGWGQVYNREPVKTPFVVAGMAGAVAFAVYRQRRYELYRRAALFAGCEQDPDSTPERVDLCMETAPDYRDEWESLGEPLFSTVSRVRDDLRGQRDIGFLVAGVVYAFQALDAFVAAELASFDVSEDVALGLSPSAEGASLGIRVRL